MRRSFLACVSAFAVMTGGPLRALPENPRSFTDGLPAALAAQAPVFPGEQWEEATPESQGVDAVKLHAAVELLGRTVGNDGTQELVIIRHGRMIWKGDDIDKRHGVWSATKSFTSTVLGLLIADGKCTLDTRVADVLPALKAHYPDVTLRHFTTMTSGYRAVGDETTGSYKHGPSGTPFGPIPSRSSRRPARNTPTGIRR